MKFRFLIPLALFGFLIAVFAFMLHRTETEGYDPKIIHSPLLGKAAPAFRLPQVEDPGKFVDSRDFLGKIYVLNVWGTWCPGCRQEHAALLEIARRQVVPIVGLDTKGPDESNELAAAQKWLSDFGNPYVATAYDGDGRAAIDWGVYGAPETFLVDAKGIVIYKHIGPLSVPTWEREFEPRIKAANDGRNSQ